MARLPRHYLRNICVGAFLGSAMALAISASGVSKPHEVIAPISASEFRDINYEDLVGSTRTGDPYVTVYSVTPMASTSPEPTAKPRETPSPKPRITHTQPIRPRTTTYSPSVQDARDYALNKVGPRQFSCLDTLWTRESHWRTRAYNRYSGAYGIPQALPGSKMSSAGSDWRTNPVTQVKWGLGYIRGRYGTACNALDHLYSHNWY